MPSAGGDGAGGGAPRLPTSVAEPGKGLAPAEGRLQGRAVRSGSRGRPRPGEGGGGGVGPRPCAPPRAGSGPRLPLPHVRGVVCPAPLLLLSSPRRRPLPQRPRVSASATQPRAATVKRAETPNRWPEAAAAAAGRGEASSGPGEGGRAGPGMLAERPPGAAACPRP